MPQPQKEGDGKRRRGDTAVGIDRRPSTEVKATGRRTAAGQAHADSSSRSASRSRAARSATSPGPSDTARSAHRCPSASSPRRA
ncbi:hypothetical protein RKD18_005442 [Streptomyces phaeoluteigriseus]